jgi:3-hydroxyacyl-CoA dehydrogenase
MNKRFTRITNRCGIPIITVSTPIFATVSITIFIAGINTSQPSRPKRFSELHFFFKYPSNLIINYL